MLRRFCPLPSSRPGGGHGDEHLQCSEGGEVCRASGNLYGRLETCGGWRSLRRCRYGGVPGEGETLRKLEVIPPQKSILAAEMLAILKALEYLCDHPNSGAVVFTDSLSSINLNSNAQSKSYLPLCYRVKYILCEINKRRPTYLQYVLGHKGICGNELADLSANAGHVLEESIMAVPGGTGHGH